MSRLELRAAGVTQVTQVGALQDAITAARSGAFDVAILDLNVQDSQGVETFRTFLSRAPNTPTVVLSGRVTPGVMIELLRAGADETLHKGEVDGVLLASAVMRAFLRHHPWGNTSNDVAADLLHLMTEQVIE